MHQLLLPVSPMQLDARPNEDELPIRHSRAHPKPLVPIAHEAKPLLVPGLGLITQNAQVQSAMSATTLASTAG